MPNTIDPRRRAKLSVSGVAKEIKRAAKSPVVLLHLIENNSTQSESAIRLPFGTSPITMPIVKPAASCSGALLARSARQNRREALTAAAIIRNPFRQSEREHHRNTPLRAV